MYREIPEELKALIEPIVEDAGFELVDILQNRGPQPWLLRITIDTPSGDGRVPVDRCAEVSREVEAHLDATVAITAPYRLEVSSPGLDRKLTKSEHFQRFEGETVKVQMRFPIEGRKRFRGTLVSTNDENIVVDVDGESHSLPMATIDTARLVPDGP